jgi:hypothetical protein
MIKAEEPLEYAAGAGVSTLIQFNDVVLNFRATDSEGA